MANGISCLCPSPRSSVRRAVGSKSSLEVGAPISVGASHSKSGDLRLRSSRSRSSGTCCKPALLRLRTSVRTFRTTTHGSSRLDVRRMDSTPRPTMTFSFRRWKMRSAIGFCIHSGPAAPFRKRGHRTSPRTSSVISASHGHPGQIDDVLQVWQALVTLSRDAKVSLASRYPLRASHSRCESFRRL